jgi:hypothetical protein
MLLIGSDMLLEKKIFEVEVAFDEGTDDLNKELITIYNDIKKLLPDSYFNITSRIDELLILKLKRCIEFSYKYCLADQLSLYSELIRFREQLMKDSVD